MTNGALLDYHIKRNGFEFTDIAKRLNITPETLRAKRNGKSCFNTEEIDKLVETLSLSMSEAMEIFFPDSFCDSNGRFIFLRTE